MDEKTVQIKELFDSLYLTENSLTVTQVNFIDSCKRQFKKNKDLSAKQISVLLEIRKYMNEVPQRVSMKIN